MSIEISENFRIPRKPPRKVALVALLFCPLMLLGCSGISLISDYDESTDKSLTALQAKVDDFVQSLENEYKTDAAAFDKNQSFYQDVDRDLRQLEFRVSSIPKNKQTIQLVANIRSSILGHGACSTQGGSLRDLHCIDSNKNTGPSPDALKLAESNINQTISAALTLELAKKQGTVKNQ